tara:strand:- start:215 stop:553 length:339 start_codon:yes stop_codon:yes gene_type:complete
MSRGTPEEDLDTYMDSQDRQQAELDKELEHAEDIAYEIIRILGMFGNWSDMDRATSMNIENGLGHVLTVEIELSSDEMESIARYIQCTNSMKGHYMINKEIKYLTKKIIWND